MFPADDVTVREALPGAVFAGVSWTVLGTVFGVYAAQAGGAQLYGVLGGVLLLLVWFYFAGLVLLLGAALNAVLAGRFEDRQLQQGALREKNQRKIMSDSDRPTTPGDEEADADESEVSGPLTDEPSADDSPSGERGAVNSPVDETKKSENTETNGDRDASDPLADEAGARAGRRVAGDETRSERVTQEDIDELHDRLARFEDEIDGRTVHRDELEAELKRYVRKRSRRNHARGWGPYLVLGYGTAMTLGAFYFLGGGWAILAMFVIWLSTLGLYVLMVMVGMTTAALGIPGRIGDRLRGLRKLR